MGLSNKQAKLIQEAVGLAGKELEIKLRPLPGRSKRNPYAHLYKAIKDTMGRSYKDCEDFEVQQIMDIIEFYTNNPGA